MSASSTLGSITAYEAAQIAELLRFESNGPTALAQAVSRASNLVNLANYGGAIEKVASLAQPLIETAVAGADHVARFAAPIGDNGRDDLQVLDGTAEKYHKGALASAAALGAAGGVLNLAGLAADIAGIVTLALTTVRKAGAIYGFNDLPKEEVMGVLSMASAGSQQEKMLTMVALRQMHTMVAKTTFKAMSTAGMQGAAVLGVREFAKTIGINLTKRKILQIIPVVGIGIGATINGAYINDVSWVARRYFQRRWLEERGKLAARESEKNDVEA